MKNILLKFNYGVEIGAFEAYVGHFERTKDQKVLAIAQDELQHQITLELILLELGDKPSKIFNVPFFIVGRTIRKLCAISPEFMLNLVARSMEFFAVVSYIELAKRYPHYHLKFVEMATTEHEHGKYFKEISL